MRINFVSLFLIFILISVVGVGFFGAVCVSKMSSVCPIFLSFGVKCPSLGSDFASAFHHLIGPKELNQFTLIFVSFFLAFSFLLFRKTFEEFFAEYHLVWKRVFQKPVPNMKLLYWLSLHNKGEPNSFFGRCVVV